MIILLKNFKVAWNVLSACFLPVYNTYEEAWIRFFHKIPALV